MNAVAAKRSEAKSVNWWQNFAEERDKSDSVHSL
jgi:hypothetical protein